MHRLVKKNEVEEEGANLRSTLVEFDRGIIVVAVARGERKFEAEGRSGEGAA